MLRLLGLVISIGMADSLNPSTVGPALYLASGENPRRSVLQFTAGTFVVCFLGGVVLTLGPGSAILALVPSPRPLARYILETIAGVAMLVIGAVLWARRGRFGRRTDEESSRPKGRAPALMGATIAAIELPTAFPYFAAIAAIVGSGFGIGRQLILLAVYNACFVAPLIAIVITLALAGDRAVQMLTRARDYLHGHWPVLAAVVALVAGVFVTTLGVTGITGRSRGAVGRFSRHLRHLITKP